MDYPIEVPLKRPITVDGETIEKLVFDEPDMGTSIAVEEAATPGEQTILLLAGMAGLPRDAMARVKERDYLEIIERVLVPYQDHIAGQAKAGNGKTAK